MPHDYSAPGQNNEFTWQPRKRTYMALMSMLRTNLKTPDYLKMGNCFKPGQMILKQLGVRWVGTFACPMHTLTHVYILHVCTTCTLCIITCALK